MARILGTDTQVNGNLFNRTVIVAVDAIGFSLFPRKFVENVINEARKVGNREIGELGTESATNAERQHVKCAPGDAKFIRLGHGALAFQEVAP